MKDVHVISLYTSVARCFHLGIMLPWHIRCINLQVICFIDSACMSVVTCTVSNCIKIHTSCQFVQISLECAFLYTFE
jgi:hypothetical protein